jgi:DNA-binding transcriptional regulator GbsR (MarR family)
VNAEHHAFVEDIGQLMAGWGIPRGTGRIWGYLLLQNGPASLAEIAADLEMARSGASVATRQLLQLGLARGIGERRSRRQLYEALHDLRGIFAASNAGVIALLQVLRRGAEVCPEGAGRDRLAGMEDMLQEFVDMAPAVLTQLRETRSTP